ncbi:MAG: fasciclin domain-containing protein, partial [Cyanobacteria bacterium P01_F01_bin.42]
TYHVVPGRLYTSDLHSGMTLTSVEGAPIPIHLEAEFEVKNATVVAADVEADNGVIHCIDTVLLMG